MKKDDTYERINITMPTKTLKKMDHAIPKGSRSEFISQVVSEHLSGVDKKTLKERLKEEAIALKDVNLEIAREWALVDDVWPE